MYKPLKNFVGVSFQQVPVLHHSCPRSVGIKINVRHLNGSVNIPSDFESHNASECTEPRYQICSFITQFEDSVVRSVHVQDTIDNQTRLPFTTRSAWLAIQTDCPALRRTHAHLKQGTLSSMKATNIKDVKR